MWIPENETSSVQVLFSLSDSVPSHVGSVGHSPRANMDHL